MHGPSKILLVDNDKALADAYRTILDLEGFSTTIAPSAQTALDILSKDSQWDLILTDYSMPFMNGAELSNEIEKRFPELISEGRVVVFSSYSASSPQVELLKSQKCLFREKPGDIFSFIHLVEELLPKK